MTRWQLVWRNLAAIAAGGLVWLTVAPAQWDVSRLLFFTDLALGILSLVAMHFRRRWPVTIALVTSAAGALSASSVGAGGIAFISMATRRRWMEILPVYVVSVAAGQAYSMVEPRQPDPWWVSLLFAAVFGGIVAAIGMYIGARRELLATLEDRADRAEREQSLRVAQAQSQERNRIAREMHDVLAHRMSLVAMHAGALTYRDDLTPDETREAAEIIQANSHRALTDLREILGVLRETETEAAPDRPQPTLGDLDDLVADERTAGARIQLKIGVREGVEVPQSIGRTAYRIVQEGLTNARKHSPDTQVDVIVSGCPGDGLTVEVSNPMRVGSARIETTPGARFGLVGLAERATLARGRFEHGRTAQGDFVVRAWLPWAA